SRLVFPLLSNSPPNLPYAWEKSYIFRWLRSGSLLGRGKTTVNWSMRLSSLFFDFFAVFNFFSTGPLFATEAAFSSRRRLSSSATFFRHSPGRSVFHDKESAVISLRISSSSLCWSRLLLLSLVGLLLFEVTLLLVSELMMLLRPPNWKNDFFLL